jgi:hypothetical protein
MESYGFVDGNGNEITRGLQMPYEQAAALAQSYADDRGRCVDMWIEGDSSEGGEPVMSLETFFPEGVARAIAAEDPE